MNAWKRRDRATHSPKPSAKAKHRSKRRCCEQTCLALEPHGPTRANQNWGMNAPVKVETTFEQFAEEARRLRRKKQLHPEVEKRLSNLLSILYPDALVHPEPHVRGGRNDLRLTFPNRRCAIFELFFTDAQVTRDLLLLATTQSDIQVAVLIDKEIDTKVERRFKSQQPKEFYFLWLSEVMLPQRQENCQKKLRQWLDPVAAATPSYAVPHHARLDRSSALDELERFSKACCRESWEAVGVPSAEASALAGDPSVGSPTPEMRPRPDKQVILLTGEIGAGKSLVAHRLLQAAIRRAREDSEAPVPVFLAAKEAIAGLEKAVKRASREIGNPRRLGAFVVVDAADEAGVAAASQLVSEARILTQTWPTSTTSVVITSRPMGSLLTDYNKEAVVVPPLTEKDAWTLVERISNRQASTSAYRVWPQSLKEAIRRPLYALLVGVYFRERRRGMPSLGELLAELVKTSLQRSHVSSAKATKLLEELALLSNNRGGAAVPLSEVTATRAAAKPLLESRLVVERPEGLVFPLAILREWFGAQSLAEGRPSVEQLLSEPAQIENWRYSFVIAVATLNHDQVSNVMRPLAERFPAIAGEIVHDALSYWDSSMALSPPPQAECGRRIRDAMMAWVAGIGPLAKLIAPVRDDGTLRPLGVQYQGNHLGTSWYHGSHETGEVMEITERPEQTPQREYHRDWPSIQFKRPGHLSAWAWEWTLEELAYELSRLVEAQKLPAGPIVHECAWPQLVALVTRKLSLTELMATPPPEVIPLSQVDELLADQSMVGMWLFSRGWCDIDGIRVYVEESRRRGVVEFRCQYPSSDVLYSSQSGLGTKYNEQRLLERANAVYQKAIVAYKQLVETWFPCFAARLQVYTLLPAQLVGIVVPPSDDVPWTRWHLEPLPSGSASIVDLKIAREEKRTMNWVLPNEVRDRVRAARPQAAGWIMPFGYQGELDVLDEPPDGFPIRKLAHKWLWHDLKQICWVSGSGII